jgi:hypothetical protein
MATLDEAGHDLYPRREESSQGDAHIEALQRPTCASIWYVEYRILSPVS